MQKTLFFTVGNRHILYRGLELAKNRLRSESQHLLEQYETEKENIRTQIVEPLIERFKDEIAEIVLIVTDQGRSPYSEQDTLFVGEIIARKVKQRYGCDQIAIKKYEGNPVEFEQIFPYMTRLLGQYAGDGTLKIICNSGGTPQMKQALLLLATNLFARREMEAYQVDEKTAAVLEVNVADTLRAQFVKRACKEFVKNYDYAAALTLLKENGMQHPQLNPLLQYGKSRLTFDFDTAKKQLDLLRNQVSTLEYRDHYAVWELQIQQRGEKIVELYRNLLVQCKRQNYVEFISRLFCLEEQLYYYFAEQKMGIDLQPKKNHTLFLQQIEADPELFAYLQKQKLNGQKLRLTDVNRPLLFFFLHYWQEYRDVTAVWNDVNYYLPPEKREKRRQALGDLRNSSIVAHGFDPVSRDIIEQRYGRSIDDLIHRLEGIVGRIEKPFKFVYDRLNERLSSLIELL